MPFPNLHLPGSGRWRALRNGHVRLRGTDDGDKDEDQPLIPSSDTSPHRNRLRDTDDEEDNGDGQDVQAPRFRNFLPAWLRSNRNPVENDTFRSFIPYPKINFIIKSPEALICGLCQITALKFGGDGLASIERRKFLNPDSIPVITPCGHVAGSSCMNTWLQADPSCPFCSMPLIYEECGHRIHPNSVTNLDLGLIPPTIPEGGVIPRSCHSCHQVALYEIAEGLYDAAYDTLCDARAQYDEHAGHEELHLLLEATKNLEGFENALSKVPMEAWRLFEW